MAIKLDLEIDDINLALGALGNLPYGQVEPLINKIRNQVVPQLPSDMVPQNAPATNTAN